jgi:NAD(P)-dependent dehydrogenase (short-subunit alcohol dehydrogenase family)
MSFAEKFRLDGKVAIITGVGPTNGQSFAKALAEAGATLYRG